MHHHVEYVRSAKGQHLEAISDTPSTQDLLVIAYQTRSIARHRVRVVLCLLLINRRSFLLQSSHHHHSGGWPLTLLLLCVTLGTGRKTTVLLEHPGYDIKWMQTAELMHILAAKIPMMVDLQLGTRIGKSSTGEALVPHYNGGINSGDIAYYYKPLNTHS